MALRPQGVFHIGMKTGEGRSRDPIGRLYTYVTEEGLRQIIQTAGLNVFAHWAGTGVGLAGTDDPYVILQARKDG